MSLWHVLSNQQVELWSVSKVHIFDLTINQHFCPAATNHRSEKFFFLKTFIYAHLIKFDSNSQRHCFDVCVVAHAGEIFSSLFSHDTRGREEKSSSNAMPEKREWKKKRRQEKINNFYVKSTHVQPKRSAVLSDDFLLGLDEG
jgi:hypothetical protein